MQAAKMLLKGKAWKGMLLPTMMMLEGKEHLVARGESPHIAALEYRGLKRLPQVCILIQVS